MSTPILKAEALSRSFGHVQALDRADFEANAGEVTALIGDNGAGKSTMVKALSGNLQLDSGQIYFEGQPVTFDSAKQVSELGVETVFQDLALTPHLDAAQNMYLGREIMRHGLLGRLGFMDTKTMRVKSRRGFNELGATVPNVTSPIGAMSGGQKQAVAIARAIHFASKVIYLDEPTAALGVRQTRNVLDTIRKVRDRGVAVVLISHSMPDVMAVADRVEVLRLGRRIATYRGSETSMEQLVGAMTGAVSGEAA